MALLGVKSFSFGGSIENEDLKKFFGDALELPQPKIGFEYYFRRGNKVFFRSENGHELSFTTSKEIADKLIKKQYYQIGGTFENGQKIEDLTKYKVTAKKA